nr:FAD-binding oxidoreductase [Schlegelella koreensis]
MGSAKRIARGAGMSYAAASFGAGSIVQQMASFDRMIAFDPVQKTLRVEAGASIGGLSIWASQRGLLMPVLPGYPTITVGGCIAADVHGKNPHRDGTFNDWVSALTLYHPAHGFREIAREREPALFDATCGGFGLTGVIVDATLRLVAQTGPAYTIATSAVESLTAARDMIEVLGQNHEFAYSWHDGTLRGRAFGKGLVFCGSWASEPEPPKGPDCRPMTPYSRGRLPACLWTPASSRWANAYFRRSALRHPHQRKSVFDASFPFTSQTLYHRMFGRRGLAEAQVLVDDEHWEAFLQGITRLFDAVDPAATMLSLKRFRGNGRSLGMCGSGTLVAIDLVREARTLRFLAGLDRLVMETRSQPNVIKDSRLPGSVAAASLPHYASFRARLRDWDPQRLYESEMSRRLDL